MVAYGTYIGYRYNFSADEFSDIELANAEALTKDENPGYGCGYAAYEWDNDWFEDTKHFSKCKQGCPEGSGTSPKYIYC